MSVTISAPETVIEAVGLRLVCDEQVDSCDFSKWKILAGKLAWDRVADSAAFDVIVDYENGDSLPLVTVIAGLTDHTDYTVSMVQGDKTLSKRVIPVEQVIPTVRLFVSVQVARHKLDLRVKDFEQLGAFVQDEPICMVIHPKV